MVRTDVRHKILRGQHQPSGNSPVGSSALAKNCQHLRNIVIFCPRGK